jgi:glycosyltransferase involved in cell wall biosynthesis
VDPRSWQHIDAGVEIVSSRSIGARRALPADAVVATSWETAEYVAEYPARSGCKYYLIQHHETWNATAERIDATWRLPLHKIVIAKWLLAHAHALGCTDVTHISNAIDDELFACHQPIEARPPRIAALYSRHPWKGTAAAAEVLKRVKRERPDVQAVMFGFGELPVAVPDWVEIRRNPTQAVLVNDIYNGSAVYLCTSEREGWHLPPAEAMACGCAVVSTDIGGVQDYAVDGQTALLAPVGDITGLGQRVLALLDDDARRTSLAQRGLAAIRALSWDTSVDKFERVVVAGERPA